MCVIISLLYTSGTQGVNVVFLNAVYSRIEQQMAARVPHYTITVSRRNEVFGLLLHICMRCTLCCGKTASNVLSQKSHLLPLPSPLLPPSSLTLSSSFPLLPQQRPVAVRYRCRIMMHLQCCVWMATVARGPA